MVNHWYPAGLKIAREVRQCARVAVAWTMWEFAAPAPGARRPCAAHRREGYCGLPSHGGTHRQSEECRDWAPLLMGLEDCGDCRPPAPSGFAGFTDAQVSTLRERLRWFDMVLGYDQVSLEALAPYIPARVHGDILQGGIAAGDWKPAERDWHDPNFGFFMHGQLGARKSPWLAVEAFQKLKYEKPGPYPQGFGDARLSLHTNTPGQLFPELNAPFARDRIRVYCEAFSRPDLDSFYAAHHAGLFPSRGEGKNLPALEFMLTRGTVLASDFGGHRQWLGADWAYPLQGTLAPTFGNKPWGARDFRVSADHLAGVMWHVYTHREEAARKAARAEEYIRKTCDWQVVVENLFRRVRDTVTSRGVGPQVYDKAMACRRQPAEPSRPGMADGWR